jgi:hypothetical protein
MSQTRAERSALPVHNKVPVESTHMSKTGELLCGFHVLPLFNETSASLVALALVSTTSYRTTRPFRLAQKTLLALESIAIDVIASPSPSSRDNSFVVAAAFRSAATSPSRLLVVVLARTSATPPSLVAHAYVTSSTIVVVFTVVFRFFFDRRFASSASSSRPTSVARSSLVKLFLALTAHSGAPRPT